MLFTTFGGNMIKIAVVEDDLSTQKSFCGYLQKFFAEKKEEYQAEFYPDAIKLLDKSTADFNLVFMDIDLPYMNGMEAAEKIRSKDKSVMIIFVTSLAQFAIQGYKVQAFDYIVKPFNYYNLSMSLNRALPSLESKGKSIAIRNSERKTEIVYLSDLMYIEVVNHYLYFHIKDRTIRSYDTLEKFKSELENNSFILCSRSFLVNLHYVKEIDHNDVLVGKEKLPLSRTKKQAFSQALNLYLSQGDSRK